MQVTGLVFLDDENRVPFLSCFDEVAPFGSGVTSKSLFSRYFVNGTVSCCISAAKRSSRNKLAPERSKRMPYACRKASRQERSSEYVPNAEGIPQAAIRLARLELPEAASKLRIDHRGTGFTLTNLDKLFGRRKKSPRATFCSTTPTSRPFCCRIWWNGPW